MTLVGKELTRCLPVMTFMTYDICHGPYPSPPERSKNIGFLCNTGPDPLKNHNATKPTFNVGPGSARQQNAISMAFSWQADGGPVKVVFGSPVIKFGPPRTKFSGSVHDLLIIFANSLDQDKAQPNVWLDLDSNWFAL